MTEPMNAEAVAIEWPREIWAKERTEFDVTGEHVFSVHATVARWEDGSEGEFHRYVDGDTMDSLKRYHDTMIADLRAENATLRASEAAAVERVRVLERDCKLTQAQVDRMLINSTQTHVDLAGCKIALEQAWDSNRERAAKITALTDALTELHAMVVGECPSIMNEDSGGNGELSCQINDLLTGEKTMKTAAGKAADVLLEHIVYYDLVERRGAEIADAVIAELVEIGVKSAITPTTDKEPKT